MILCMWTQFNITETWNDVIFYIVPRSGVICYSFRKGLCPSKWRLLLCKKYAFRLTIKRIASGLAADHNVYWNVNFCNLA